MQTFVVRVWTTAPPNAWDTEPTRLRGVVQHLATGRSETFTDDRELLAFLRERPQPATAGEGNGGRS